MTIRKVLLISLYFPPHTGAASHRMRLLAPHLRRFGWEPTVLTVDSAAYEERLDPGLLSLVPPDLHVIRCGAISARLTRRIGLGDLALRSLGSLYLAAETLLTRDRYDAFVITLPPHLTAVLGPSLRRRTGCPFVIDYQDPWIGAWGLTVGGGPGGRVDFKSRASRWAGQLLEPRVIRAADGLIGVSTRTYEEILARLPLTRPPVCAEIPLGGEPADFEAARRSGRTNRFFDPNDGHFHLCYVGTLLPLGFETLRAVLRGVAVLRDRRPDLARRLRLRFFGTSNQTAVSAPASVLPVAHELGVSAHVHEVAPRIDYLDALTVLTDSSGVLMMGSSERHYTASKLYPGLLARRPVLAVYHEASLVSSTLARWTSPPTVQLITYTEEERAETRSEAVAEALEVMVQDPTYDPNAISLTRLLRSAEDLSREFAGVLDAVVVRNGKHS